MYLNPHCTKWNIGGYLDIYVVLSNQAIVDTPKCIDLIVTDNLFVLTHEKSSKIAQVWKYKNTHFFFMKKHKFPLTWNKSMALRCRISILLRCGLKYEKKREIMVKMNRIDSLLGFYMKPDKFFLLRVNMFFSNLLILDISCGFYKIYNSCK
jgi:hypothetical protein